MNKLNDNDLDNVIGGATILGQAVSGSSDTSSYKCDYCGKAFLSANDLLEHQDRCDRKPRGMTGMC